LPVLGEKTGKKSPVAAKFSALLNFPGGSGLVLKNRGILSLGRGTADQRSPVPDKVFFRKDKHMKISARNQLAGKVQKVVKGAVNSEVDLVLEGGETVVAIITNSSVDTLGLAAGKEAFAIIKASEVIVGKGVDGSKLSTRNVLAGEVTAVHDGAVNSEVDINLPGGTLIAASITKASTHTLGLKAGDKVSAIIKASNVIVGVPH
jgi:molybdate transport system regulatory protein